MRKVKSVGRNASGEKLFSLVHDMKQSEPLPPPPEEIVVYEQTGSTDPIRDTLIMAESVMKECDEQLDKETSSGLSPEFENHINQAKINLERYYDSQTNRT